MCSLLGARTTSEGGAGIDRNRQSNSGNGGVWPRHSQARVGFHLWCGLCIACMQVSDMGTYSRKNLKGLSTGIDV